VQGIDRDTVTPVPLQVERRAAEVRIEGDPVPGVRRLLIARTDRLGDLVLSLPAVAALARTYPQAALGLMVRPANGPLAAMVPGIEAVLEAGPDVARMREEMERFKPDLLVCISRSAPVARAGWRAKIPHRIGPGHRFYSGLFTRRVDERRRAGERHELEYALSFAHRAGAPGGEAVFPLELPDSAVSAASRRLDELGLTEPFTVLHPGSGGSCPNWPAGSFLELARSLRRAGRAVVVTRGPAEQALAGSMPEGDRESAEIPWFDGELPVLAALLARASLVVSNSTGPLHLAAALGAPTLALHAPWPTCGPGRWGPYAGNGWALVADHPEARRWPRRARRANAAALMSAISPETVLHHVLSLLEPAGGE
jgi:ADP-heptose:LPS heptosyltransferase